MTHYAVMWMFGNYLATHKPGGGQLTFIIIAGLIILPAFAYLVMVLYDTPVRNYLNRKRQKD
jgi:peptidoglycan/LPS O-acetylase OafA/YrhL